eukprot:jgi/Bigna1/139796/aug1.52_g14504
MGTSTAELCTTFSDGLGRVSHSDGTPTWRGFSSSISRRLHSESPSSIEGSTSKTEDDSTASLTESKLDKIRIDARKRMHDYPISGGENRGRGAADTTASRHRSPTEPAPFSASASSSSTRKNGSDFVRKQQITSNGSLPIAQKAINNCSMYKQPVPETTRKNEDNDIISKDYRLSDEIDADGVLGGEGGRDGDADTSSNALVVDPSPIGLIDPDEADEDEKQCACGGEGDGDKASEAERGEESFMPAYTYHHQQVLNATLSTTEGRLLLAFFLKCLFKAATTNALEQAMAPVLMQIKDRQEMIARIQAKRLAKKVLVDDVELQHLALDSEQSFACEQFLRRLCENCPGLQPCRNITADQIIHAKTHNDYKIALRQTRLASISEHILKRRNCTVKERKIQAMRIAQEARRQRGLQNGLMASELHKIAQELMKEAGQKQDRQKHRLKKKQQQNKQLLAAATSSLRSHASSTVRGLSHEELERKLRLVAIRSNQTSVTEAAGRILNLTGSEYQRLYLDFRRQTTRFIKTEQQGPLRRGHYKKLRGERHSRGKAAAAWRKKSKFQHKGFSGGKLVEFLIKASMDLMARNETDGKVVLVRGVYIQENPSLDAIRKQLEMHGMIEELRVLYVARTVEQQRREEQRQRTEKLFQDDEEEEEEEGKQGGGGESRGEGKVNSRRKDSSVDVKIRRSLEEWFAVSPGEVLIYCAFKYRTSVKTAVGSYPLGQLHSQAQVLQGLGDLISKMPEDMAANLQQMFKAQRQHGRQLYRGEEGGGLIQSQDGLQQHKPTLKERVESQIKEKRRQEGAFVASVLSKSLLLGDTLPNYGEQQLNYQNNSIYTQNSSSSSSSSSSAKTTRMANSQEPPPDLRATASSPSTLNDDPHGVGSLLGMCNLTRYSPAFEECGYDDVDFIVSADPDEWTELVGHTRMKPGHAAKLKRAISSIRNKRPRRHT